MDVSRAGAGAAAYGARRQAGATVDGNIFIQLLIAQAKNQDPTSPSDPAQYVQQYAAMAQVQQATSTNDKLDVIMSQIAALTPAAAKS